LVEPSCLDVSRAFQRRVAARAFRSIAAVAIAACLAWLPTSGALADDAEAQTLTLSEAIRTGLEHDPTVRQAEIELQIARLELDAEISGFLLPTVNLDFSPPSLTTDGWSGSFAGTVSAGLALPIGTSSQLSGKVNLAWDPATASWGASRWDVSYSQRLSISQSDGATGSIATRRDAVAEAETLLIQAQSELVTSVSRSFAKLLSARDALDQAERDLASARDDLDQAQRDFDAGLIAETALIDARISALDREIALASRGRDLAEKQEEFYAYTLGMVSSPSLAAPDFAQDEMADAAEALLADEEAIDRAIAASSAVIAAEEDLASAKKAAASSRVGVAPEVRLQAGLSDEGYTLGCSVSLTLFDPTWSEQAKIATLQMELAEARLNRARRQAETSIRTSRNGLETALEEVRRVPLEEEKWTLQEQATRSRLDAGSISPTDWSEFARQQDAFRLDVNERSTALFAALLEYRSALGLPLEWERWLE
jgi:outer membrane protein TolC